MMFGQGEAGKIIKFILVGGSTFVLQTLLYLFLSRLLLSDLSLTYSYAVALVFAVTYNYVGHRAWTFREQNTGGESVWRYVFVLVGSMVLSSFLFWLGASRLKFHDVATSVAVGMVIPLFTYLAHRQFTFRPKVVYNDDNYGGKQF